MSYCVAFHPADETAGRRGGPPSAEGAGAVIVTGASRGIGAAVAKVLAAHGCPVAVNFVRNEGAASSIVDQIGAAGGRAVAIQADVGRPDDVERLFVKAERTLGPIRGLVNNAGVTGGFARLDSLTVEALAHVFAVNVTGTILCAREAVRRMSTRSGGSGGAIVNVSSVIVHLGGAGELVHYAASKAAIQTFTIGLAREVAREGIRVNVVAPGLIDPDDDVASGVRDRIYRLRAQIPMARTGTPREVAEGVLWLLSSAASYTTGTILEIGGGR